MLQVSNASYMGKGPSILGPKERKTSLMQLKIFFYVKQIHTLIFQRKNVFGNMAPELSQIGIRK